MTKVHRHEGKGGWLARVHGYRETPRPEQDPREERLSSEPDFDYFYGGDCATVHGKPDGKLFGPDSILRVPETEIVEVKHPD